MMPRRVLETIIGEHEAGRPVALCFIVATRGSTPQPAGVMVCVDEAASLVGTLGGGCVEADVRRLAHQQLRQPTGRVTTFQLDADFGYDDGMICGGQMDVAIGPIAATDDITPYRAALAALATGGASIPIRITQAGREFEYRVAVEPTPRLYIAGAGHISRVLAPITANIGFDTHVIDDRSQYANDRRFPAPIHTHVGAIGMILQEQPIDANSYVVIVTRGHKHDEVALEAVLNTPAEYIGMIGSRRKIKVIFDDLIHRGAQQEALARAHAPIGLPIGAVTTDEIAVAIAAELIQVRRKGHRQCVEGPFPVTNAT